MNYADPFDALKRRRSSNLIEHPAGTGSCRFQLIQDDFGYYLVTCDDRLNQVFFHEHHAAGPVRRALSVYNRLSNRNDQSWTIQWDRVPGRLYLHEHSELTEAVLLCDTLIDHEGTPLQLHPAPGRLVLEGSIDENILSTRVCFETIQGVSSEKLSFLTASIVRSGNTLYRTAAVPAHGQLNYFTCSVPLKEAGQLYSLFASSFPGVEIRHLDYSMKEGRVIHTRAALLFEQVTEEKELFLEVVRTAEGLDSEFLNSYDIRAAAEIHDENREVVISAVSMESIDEGVKRIEKLLKRLQSQGTPDMGYDRLSSLFIISAKLAEPLLQQELYTLVSEFTILGSEHLLKYRISMVKPNLKLTVGSGIDFLEGSAEVTLGEQPLGLGEFFRQFEKNRFILLSDGTKAVIDPKLVEKMKRLLNPDASGNLKISFFDLPLVTDFIDERTSSGEFISSRRILEGFNTLQERNFPVPELTSPLREYQKRGVWWLSYLKEHSLGGCLADDMGLGKTIQTIAVLSSLYPDHDQPSLIVMPKSILLNWQREINRFSPGITSVIYHGSDRNLEQALTCNVILTTYATVRNDIESLKEQHFAYVILDESQNIKNIGSQISKAVMLLNAQWRLALSGTPVENSIWELYALFRFLNPAMFRTMKRFQQDYADPIMKYQDDQALSDLKKKIYPFLLRRLKSEVLTDLPEKNEQVSLVKMSDAHRRYYEQRRQFYQDAVRMQIAREGMAKSGFFLFQAMNELRQLASIPEAKSSGVVRSPKVEMLGEYLEETVLNGHKALVFANFLEALSLMETELERRGITFLKITGAVRNRTEIVDLFQNGDEHQVLLMTLKTGGTGLNLTAADYVYIFDPWWNAAAEQQAVDRVHRIGQVNKVFSYKLITKDTIEEKILLLQQKKSELAGRLIEEDAGSIKSLTEDDIEFIFSGSQGGMK